MSTQARPRWKKVLWSVVALIAVPVVLLVLAILYVAVAPSVEDYAHRRRFDSNLWQVHPKDDDPEWPIRLRMVDDLLVSKTLEGSTRREVESLLGPGDETDYWKDWHLVYWLGPERGHFRIDSEWLVVRFNSDGRVAEYLLVRD